MTSEERPASPMRYRKLRIVWSVGWGIAAVLLCVLWARSYRVHHTFSFNYATSSVDIASGDGGLSWFRATHATPLEFGWHLSVNSPDDELYYYVRYARPQLEKPPQGEVRYWHLTTACVIAAAAFATVPWLPYRFCLRTLLIATALVAVLLGLIVWAVRN